MATTLEPWDRQPAETGPAYAAFITYRDLGPDRSIDKAYLIYLAKREAKKRPRPDGTHPERPTSASNEATGTWTGWSVRHQWGARVRAWDAHLEKARQNAILDEMRKSATVSDAEWEIRRLKQRQAEWDLRTALITRATEMIKFPLVVKTSEEISEADGAVIKRITVFKPARWSMYTAVEMLKLASDLGRLATNMKPKPDDERPPDFDAMFESNGTLDDALPAGAAPVMPDDPFAKPDIAGGLSGSNPHGLTQPPKTRPPGG